MGRDRSGPVRTCVGCRQRSPVADLIRTVRLPDGSLRTDRTAPGRGAWICRAPHSGAPRAGCVDLADRRSSLERALRGPISAASIAALRATTSEREMMDDGAAVDAAPSGRD